MPPFSFSAPASPPAALSVSLTCAPSRQRLPKSSASPSPPPKQSLCSPDLSPFVDASSGDDFSRAVRPSPYPVCHPDRSGRFLPPLADVSTGRAVEGSWLDLSTGTVVGNISLLLRPSVALSVYPDYCRGSRSGQVHRSSSGSRKRSHKDR